MDFDNSWEAVLHPGKATVFFDVLGDTKFDPDAASYSKINAWWLAELCRLIYRQGADEIENGRWAYPQRSIGRRETRRG